MSYKDKANTLINTLINTLCKSIIAAEQCSVVQIKVIYGHAVVTTVALQLVVATTSAVHTVASILTVERQT